MQTAASEFDQGYSRGFIPKPAGIRIINFRIMHYQIAVKIKPLYLTH